MLSSKSCGAFPLAYAAHNYRAALAAAVFGGALLACAGSTVVVPPDSEQGGGPLTSLAGPLTTSNPPTTHIPTTYIPTTVASSSQGSVHLTAIVADTPVAAACLADIQRSCDASLAGCEADVVCSQLLQGCLNAGGSTRNCMSAAPAGPGQSLFLCLYYLPTCNGTPPTGSADAG